MKRLTNETFKKEFRKVNNNLIVAIVCIVLGILCLGIGYYAENRVPKDTKYLNDIIESEEIKRTDIAVNLKITMEPVLFAKMSNNSNKKYYITTDENYFYIISLTDSQYNKLKAKDFEKNPITIYGKTKEITSDIQRLAISYYNKAVEEEDQITNDTFYNQFGDLYLDSTSEDTTATILYVIGALSNLVGYCFLLVFGIMKFQLNRTFKKIDDEELHKIENEIEDKEAFHYEKARLILTKNYIISFLSGFKTYKYEDIIWLYEYRLRQYGITTQKSIMVMDKTGKVKPIITLDGVTKKSKLVFDEIAETILSKNNKIIVGYNKENRKKIKEEYNF